MIISSKALSRVIVSWKLNHSSGYFPKLLVKDCRATYNDVSAWLVKDSAILPLKFVCYFRRRPQRKKTRKRKFFNKWWPGWEPTKILPTTKTRKDLEARGLNPGPGLNFSLEFKSVFSTRKPMTLKWFWKLRQYSYFNPE